MNPSTSPSSTNANSKPNIDWAKVVEVVIAILTLGLSHIRKHNNQTGK